MNIYEIIQLLQSIVVLFLQCCGGIVGIIFVCFILMFILDKIDHWLI